MSVDSTQATSTSSRAEAVDLALDKILEAEVLRQLWPIMGRLPVEHEEHAGQDEGSSAYLRSNTDSPLARVLYTRSRLPQLDADSRKLWKALYAFRPVVSDYAEGGHPPVSGAPRGAIGTPACPFAASAAKREEVLDSVRRAFNRSDLSLPLSAQGSWYGVVFRSVKRSLDNSSPADLADLQARWDALYAADALSHEEAVASGALMMYWYGTPSARTGANLATCVWTSREDALKASVLSLHKQAVKLATGAYETYELARYRIVKPRGAHRVSLESW